MSHRYVLQRFLGQGGMGTVYQAESTIPGRRSFPVACKIMRSDLREQARFVELFHREAMINLRIANNHEGLVAVYHYFQDTSDRLILVMEYVPGCNLRKFIRACGSDERIPFDVVRFIAQRLLGALAYTHEHEVLHRDLSPSNVLLSVEGEVKLSDLGFAKTMEQGRAETSLGPAKLAYASPEALDGAPMDVRSDLYSFGAMLYEMLGGRPPFGRGLTMSELLEKVKSWEIPELPGDIPADLRDLAMGLLQREPDERRPQRAREAMRVLGMRGEDDEQSMASREELKRMVSRIHKKQTTPQGPLIQHVAPFDAIDVPAMVHFAADPFSDTELDVSTEGHDSTGSVDASRVGLSEASMSGPQEPADAASGGDDASDESRGVRVPRSWPKALAVAAAIAIGFVGNMAFDAWQAHSPRNTVHVHDRVEEHRAPSDDGEPANESDKPDEPVHDDPAPIHEHALVEEMHESPPPERIARPSRRGERRVHLKNNGRSSAIGTVLEP